MHSRRNLRQFLTGLWLVVLGTIYYLSEGGVGGGGLSKKFQKNSFFLSRPPSIKQQQKNKLGTPYSIGELKQCPPNPPPNNIRFKKQLKQSHHTIHFCFQIDKQKGWHITMK